MGGDKENSGAKWLSGVLATVLAGVLTWAIIRAIDPSTGPVPEGLPTSPPSQPPHTASSSPGKRPAVPAPPPWKGTLTQTEVQSVLISVGDLPTGYRTGQDPEVDGARIRPDRSITGKLECLDVTSNLFQGPASVTTDRVSLTRSDLANGIISVFEAVGSFQSVTDAKSAMNSFRDWMNQCRKAFYPEIVGGTEETEQINFGPHGDETASAQYDVFSQDVVYVTSIVVVMRVARTILLVRLAGGDLPPTVTQADSLVTTIENKLYKVR